MFGPVKSVKVGAVRRGRPKGFGYVEMADNEAAAAAVQALRGKELNGRLMDVILEQGRGGGPPRRRR